jgi:hypothetical protein
MLKNPFVIYILSFGGALAIYQFGWSEIYPDLTLDTLAFLSLTFVLAAGFGLVIEPAVIETSEYTPGQMPGWMPLLLFVVCVIDIAYAGQIPLISMLRGTYKYGVFAGVPTLHVFAATFGGAFATVRFADFLYAKGWLRARYLSEAMLPLVYFLLINYRGFIVIAVVSWGFVYIIKRGSLGRFAFPAMVLLALGSLYLFGALGNARNSGSIEVLGHPTRAFTDSGVPRTYFWGYIYSTSPLANLQHTVDAVNPRFDASAGIELLIAEMLPDFLSNRILPWLSSERVATPEIWPGLNVATIFGRSYLYFGWIGVLLMLTWFFTLTTVYFQMILKSPYRVPCLALLNTLIVFCIFDNMIAQTFLMFQLVWPLLLPLLPRRSLSTWPRKRSVEGFRADNTSLGGRPDQTFGYLPSQVQEPNKA